MGFAVADRTQPLATVYRYINILYPYCTYPYTIRSVRTVYTTVKNSSYRSYSTADDIPHHLFFLQLPILLCTYVITTHNNIQPVQRCYSRQTFFFSKAARLQLGAPELAKSMFPRMRYRRSHIHPKHTQ